MGRRAQFSGACSAGLPALDHKTVFAIISWLIAAACWSAGICKWRPKAQYWTLAGFIALMLVYVGGRFVAEVVFGPRA